jgi:cyclopropane-fatty-acyl-phospholipid synthase
MNSIIRAASFITESFSHGPLYGLARHRIRNPEPLDPEENWDFWTRTRSPLMMKLLDSYPPAFFKKLLVKARFLHTHEAGIAAHYDVSNEFYKLFLDKKYMFYSCADFHRDDETLEQAQENKANFILNLINPRKGERILELGCGWGAMLRHIYEATGDADNLFGYTLSKKQVEYLNEHYGFNIIFTDFINALYEDEAFDKIYSIGAWEHVRPHEILVLLRKLHRALKPGGRLVQHFFCLPDRHFPASMLVGQIYFPGSVLASYPYQIDACLNAGFRVVHESQHDYRPTLRAWHGNLVNNKDKAIALVGTAMYNKYLVFFPLAWKMFNEGEARVHRLVLEKPGAA